MRNQLSIFIFLIFHSSFCLGVIESRFSTVLKGPDGRWVILYGDIHTKGDDNPLWPTEELQISHFRESLRKLAQENPDLNIQILHEHMESFGTNFLPTAESTHIDVKYEFFHGGTYPSSSILKGTHSQTKRTFLSAPIDQETLDYLSLSLFSIDPRFLYTLGVSNPETLSLEAIKTAGIATREERANETSLTPVLLKLKEQILKNYESFLIKAFGVQRAEHLIHRMPLASFFTLGDLLSLCFIDKETTEREKARILQLMQPRDWYYSIEMNVASMKALSELRLEYQVLSRIDSHPKTLSVCIVGKVHYILLLELLMEEGFSVVGDPIDLTDSVIKHPLEFLGKIFDSERSYGKTDDKGKEEEEDCEEKSHDINESYSSPSERITEEEVKEFVSRQDVRVSINNEEGLFGYERDWLRQIRQHLEAGYLNPAWLATLPSNFLSLVFPWFRHNRHYR